MNYTRVSHQRFWRPRGVRFALLPFPAHTTFFQSGCIGFSVGPCSVCIRAKYKLEKTPSFYLSTWYFAILSYFFHSVIVRLGSETKNYLVMGAFLDG